VLHANETAIAIKHLKIMQHHNVNRNRDGKLNDEKRQSLSDGINHENQKDAQYDAHQIAHRIAKAKPLCATKHAEQTV
jgi:hypothetical protein